MPRARAHASGAAVVAAVVAIALLPGALAHGYMDQPKSRNMYAAEEGKWYASPTDDTARIPRIENCKHCLNRYQTPQVETGSSYCGITQDNLRGYQDMINYDGGILVDPPVQQTYIEGSRITLNFQLTAHHRGHVEFGLCCKDPSTTSDTAMQECFNRNKLKFLRDIRYEANPDPNYPWRGYVAPSGSPSLNTPVIPSESSTLVVSDAMPFTMEFQLPDSSRVDDWPRPEGTQAKLDGPMYGDRCIIQWTYITGNSCEDVGYDKYAWKSPDWRGGNGGLATCTFPETHKGERFPAGDGAGGYWGTKAPERFWNCADVKIFSNNDNPPPLVPDPPVVPPVAPPVIPPEPEPERPILDPETSAGSATFSTYFDGCKPRCANPQLVAPTEEGTQGYVTACDGPIKNKKTPQVPVNVVSNDICEGPLQFPDTAYQCLNQSPWYDGDGQRFGFASGSFPCCQCFELTFKKDDSAIGNNDNYLKGTMVVQVTDSGGDLGDKYFNLQIPGAGFGVFNAVAENSEGEVDPDHPNDHINGDPLFTANSFGGKGVYANWGERYGGVDSKGACNELPTYNILGYPGPNGKGDGKLRDACKFQFQAKGLKSAVNPNVYYTRVQCPKVLTDISGCKLSGEEGLPLYGEEATKPKPPPPTPEPEAINPPPGQPAEFPPAQSWGACGGLSNLCMQDRACTTCAEAGYICIRGNEWYWQCRNDQSDVQSTFDADFQIIEASEESGKTVGAPLWGLCGGARFCGRNSQGKKIRGQCVPCANPDNKCSKMRSADGRYLRVRQCIPFGSPFKQAEEEEVEGLLRSSAPPTAPALPPAPLP